MNDTCENCGDYGRYNASFDEILCDDCAADFVDQELGIGRDDEEEWT